MKHISAFFRRKLALMTSTNAQDFGEARNNMQQLLLTGQHASAPRKSRQKCLDETITKIRANRNHDWVRHALDLTSHTLFRTERVSSSAEPGTLVSCSTCRHWAKLCEVLTECYGSAAEELKLFLITGSFAEMEVLLGGEVDDLLDPYRATRDIQAWLRHFAADRPRGVDIEALKELERQYNSNPDSETPLHQLVESGLSRVINLHSTDDIKNEYRRVFVDRVGECTASSPMIPIFALSYKHESRDLRMSENNFLEVCTRLKDSGFEKVQLWIDAVLKKSDEKWARRGLLPYTVLPVVVHNNEMYEKGRDRIWLKLERVAASGRRGVLFSRPTSPEETCDIEFVSGESRNLVAACILCKDYNSPNDGYKEDEDDLIEWAKEHLAVATFRSFLGISRMGRGRVPEVSSAECIQSAILKYNETMPNGRVEIKNYGLSNGGDSRKCRSARARNERIMTHVCVYKGATFVVRVSRGFGVTVSKIEPTDVTEGVARIGHFSKALMEERRQVLQSLTYTLIVPEEEAGVAEQLFGGEQELVILDGWNRWPQLFPAY